MEEMSRLAISVIEIAEDLRECPKHKKQLTVFESLQIAVLIQKNALFEVANVIGYSNAPVALEKIGMELSSVASELSSIASELSDITSK
jgi:hypothetical protein